MSQGYLWDKCDLCAPPCFYVQLYGLFQRTDWPFTGLIKDRDGAGLHRACSETRPGVNSASEPK